MNTQSFAAATEAMVAELNSDPLFMPSAFWAEVNAKNNRMLAVAGLENFKRTVSQNYYNWFVSSLHDPQFREVFRQLLRRPSIQPLMSRIEKNIELRLISTDTPVYLTANQRHIYRLFVAGLWEIMLRHDAAGLADKLDEPVVGNPIRISRRGHLISQDLANSIIECNAILEHFPDRAKSGKKLRVAEIGAGYGRLAHVFSATQNGTYCIFDIPPALQVSQWYLPRVLPDKKVFVFRKFEHFSEIEAELEKSDLAFFTANQIRAFPKDYFDAVTSISTLPELSHEQVTFYLQLFPALSRRLIFLKQWRQWKNPSDGTDLTIDDYRFPEPWRLVSDQRDPTNPPFFNRTWLK